MRWYRLSQLQKPGGTPTGCTLIRADDLTEWLFEISVLGESVYKGETFALRFRFSPQFPIDAPEVVFLSDARYQPPLHGHVYSNGHICASILGSAGWSPVLNVAAVLLTLQSMLASSKERTRPPDNERYVRNAPSTPKQTRFVRARAQMKLEFFRSIMTTASEHSSRVTVPIAS